MAQYDVTDFGAKGDGVTDDREAIQKTIDTCLKNGGGRVVFPSGNTFLTGSLDLGSYLDLHIEMGARLRAKTGQGDYTHYAFPDRSHDEGQKRVFLHARNCEHLSFSGQGIIDGQGHAFMVEEKPYIYRGNMWRPALFCLVSCRHVSVKDVTILNAANWALHLSGCEDVLIEGIRILNDLKLPNCDGIDPDHCRNVRIANCHIEAGDDCIVLKNHPAYPELGPTENITVTGCTLISTSSAVKIGTESVDDFRNIVVDACVISRSNRGLSIQLRDSGSVENVIFSNCIINTRLFYQGWWGKAEPIYVTAVPRNAGAKVGRIRNVHFHNILCRGENGIFIDAHEPGGISDLLLDNVTVTVEDRSRWPGGIYDLRPCEGEGLWKRATAGIFARHVHGLALRHCRVDWDGGPREHYGPALETHSVRELELAGFRGRTGNPGKHPDRVHD